MLQTHDHVEVKENETLTLTCPVKNPGNAELEWLQDGQPIAKSPHVQV
jgi:hypothetical protein